MTKKIVIEVDEVWLDKRLKNINAPRNEKNRKMIMKELKHEIEFEVWKQITESIDESLEWYMESESDWYKKLFSTSNTSQNQNPEEMRKDE